MIVLGAAFNVSEIVIFAVVVFQFLASLLTGQPNTRLTHFGRNLARYLQQIISYLTFSTEDKPFPFSSWPNEPQEESVATEVENPLSSETESAGPVADADEAEKPKKRASRKTATTSKPRTNRKKQS